MSTILLSFLYLFSSTSVFSQYSTSFPVHSVDHSHWFSSGKYFNFCIADVDAILGRTDWNSEVFRVMVEREEEVVETEEVRLWRNNNGGSIGDAHGRREESAEVDDWIVGDMVMFYEGNDWRAYDHSIGNEAWYYSMGSYCDKPVVESWTKGLNDGPTQTASFEILKVIETPDTSLSSYVGFDNANSRILISVRGTANWDNWFSVNADWKPMIYPNAPSLSDPTVFSGFYDAWKELEAAGLGEAIKSAIAQKPEYGDVFLTGHSMGAAIAGIAAMELRLSPTYKALPIKRVDVVTFGSPRWCNEQMAELFNAIIDSNWRIVNRYDTVVTVPIKAMGYYHVGTEIWYRWQRWWWNEDPISYKICNGSGEDHSCYGTDYWPDKIDPRIGHHHTTYFALSRDKLCATEDERRRRLMSGKRLLDLHA